MLRIACVFLPAARTPCFHERVISARVFCRYGAYTLFRGSHGSRVLSLERIVENLGHHVVQSRAAAAAGALAGGYHGRGAGAEPEVCIVCHGLYVFALFS